MFIYMRALKCHPAIEQSGQAKYGGEVSALVSDGLRILDGLSNGSPTRSDIQLWNITEMESLEVLLALYHKNHKTPKWMCITGRLRSQESKQKYVLQGNVFFLLPNIQSNTNQTCHVAGHDACGGSWMRVRSAMAACTSGGLGGQPEGQTILCKPTPICSPALYARPALFSRCQIFFLKTGSRTKQPLTPIQGIKGSTLCHMDRKMSTNTKCKTSKHNWTDKTIWGWT